MLDIANAVTGRQGSRPVEQPAVRLVLVRVGGRYYLVPVPA
jgi:hypothetical protein